VSSPVWRRRRLLANVRKSTRQVRRGLAYMQHHQHQVDPLLLRYVLNLGIVLDEFQRARLQKVGGKR
jgi:hypothetical protein